jgi:hypothetical protein|eukprot:6845726-Prymnesium_polylepis.1
MRISVLLLLATGAHCLLIAYPLGPSGVAPWRASSPMCQADDNEPSRRALRIPEETASRESTLEEQLIALQQKNEARGRAALGLVLLVVLWFFSVPPAIRRTNVCPPQLVAPPTETFYSRDVAGCVGVDTLWQSVLEHYQTCGGANGAPCIDFDFSIDPKSRAAFDETVRSLRESTSAAPST